MAVDTTGFLFGKTIVQIACGYTHSALVTADGLVFTWGDNRNGALGISSTTNYLVPIQVDNTGAMAGKFIIHVACGNSYTFALSSDGKLFSWGLNSNNQLGDRTGNTALAPIAVDQNPPSVIDASFITQIFTGESHVYAISNTNAVFSWGRNEFVTNFCNKFF